MRGLQDLAEHEGAVQEGTTGNGNIGFYSFIYLFYFIIYFILRSKLASFLSGDRHEAGPDGPH